MCNVQEKERFYNFKSPNYSIAMRDVLFDSEFCGFSKYECKFWSKAFGHCSNFKFLDDNTHFLYHILIPCSPKRSSVYMFFLVSS